MADRRFDDAEVAEIFRKATSAGAEHSPGGSSNGMTLAQLQDIGREVGVSPDRIAAAAAEVDVPSHPSPRAKSLGMPIAVSRTVELPKRPTDRDWDVLLGELREVFAAQGRESSRGEIRRWSNGNLFAIIEPTESGHRLRLGTRKSDALAINLVGSTLLLMAMATLFGLLGESSAGSAVTLAIVGSVLVGYNVLRLPTWAETRERQMEHIAARALAIVGGGNEAGEGRF